MRAAGQAAKRRAVYDNRIAAAQTERAKSHALVWWWLAEWYRLDDEGRQAAFRELETATARLNEKDPK